MTAIQINIAFQINIMRFDRSLPSSFGRIRSQSHGECMSASAYSNRQINSHQIPLALLVTCAYAIKPIANDTKATAIFVRPPECRSTIVTMDHLTHPNWLITTKLGQLQSNEKNAFGKNWPSCGTTTTTYAQRAENKRKDKRLCECKCQKVL